MHTPVKVTVEALALVKKSRTDGTIAIGDWSAVGLGKAIALRTGVPQAVAPTTYSGLETTAILGVQIDGVTTITPQVAFYDVDLTKDLPVET